MITQITRKIEFDAGHRVLGHEGRCANLHGHRYTAEITISADKLDSVSRVVDFSVIKEKVGGWIDENWDHNILLHVDDPLLAGVKKLKSQDGESMYWSELIFGDKPPYIIPGAENPTAEVIAKLLFRKAQELLSGELTIVRVRILETPNCWADYAK